MVLVSKISEFHPDLRRIEKTIREIGVNINQHCHLVGCMGYSKRHGRKVNIEPQIRYVFITGLKQLFS